MKSNGGRLALVFVLGLAACMDKGSVDSAKQNDVTTSNPPAPAQGASSASPQQVGVPATATAAARDGGGAKNAPPPGLPQCAPGDPLCSEETPSHGGKRRLKIQAATTSAMGGRLTTAQVEEAVAANIDGFSSCTKNDTTVTMRALISGKGQVVEATSTRSAPDDARVRDCISAAFRRITFPTSDGGNVPITFDLVLSAS